MTVISCDGVWKRFRVTTGASSYGRLSEVLSRGAGRLFSRRGAVEESETFWALQDVGFSVPSGQAVALVGHNGAGKSTLLKVLSRITRPTRGRVGLAGRVGSLLEVGTGFHPELTGRENIFVNAAILGMSRRRARSKLDEIVDFAEVERFLDTPVKRYSSGMKMRLAFSVAAHLDPEILLIDEVLAVGDAAFQRKCLGRMSGVAESGRTVLFVSHNMVAVRALCSRAIWLDHGELRQDGLVEDVVPAYASSFETSRPERSWELEDAPGDDVARVRRVAVECDGPVNVHTPLRFVIEYEVLREAEVAPVVMLSTVEQMLLFGARRPPVNPESEAGDDLRQPGIYRAEAIFPGDLLNEGGHTLGAILQRNRTEIIAKADHAVTFTVDEDPTTRDGGLGRYPGLIRPPVEWSDESV